MPPSLSLSSTVSVLPCPNCKQTINTSMQTCPFCSASIDHAAAAASAELFARVNQAISDAGFLKVMAGATGGFFLVSLLPFVGGLGNLGFLFLAVATPVMVVRWFVKFRDLASTDPDFVSARHAAIAVAICSASVLLALLAAFIFLHRLV
jgi:hypothetical protein